MDKIIVGIDGTEHSQAVLAWTTGLASALDAELTVVQALTPPQSEMSPDAFSDFMAEAEPRFDKACAPVRNAGVTYEGVLREGRPQTMLFDVALGAEADLLVVGTHGEGGRAGSRLGSVTEHIAHEIAHEGPCALMTVPAAGGPLDGTIVFGIDGSDANARALATTVGLAATLAASVRAVYSRDEVSKILPTRVAEHRRHKGEERARAVVGGLDTEVDVKLEIVDGEAVDALTREASGSGAALIAAGTHSRGPHRLGSVADDLIRQGDRPVLIVPRPRPW